MENYAEKFKNFDTTSISDAMDKLGIQGGLYGIKPVCSGGRMCGTAFTVHYVPCGMVKGTVGDFLDDVKSGQVVVIDNSGRDTCTVWGDIMTAMALKKGIAGTVIDGVCRDLHTIRKLGYPIFSKGYYMVTGKDRVEVDAVNIPVSISGVQVKDGDIIVADESGSIVIPLEKAEQILCYAQEIEQKEQLILKEINSGSTLKQARQKMGYYLLQRKGTKSES